MTTITLVELAEPDQSGLGVWQLRDGAKVLGHVVAKPEAFETIVDGLKLLAAAHHVAHSWTPEVVS